ncbi:MAG: hypothetical protein V9G14_17690 [Cypionkella sp.]
MSVEDGSESSPRRLDAILRALPDKELASLIARMGIRVDPGKRIDTPSQAARALVGMPGRARHLAPLHFEPRAACTASPRPAARWSSHRCRPGSSRSWLAASCSVGASTLGIELVLPTAFLLQLKSWEGEDPRALRALLAQAPFETLSAIASHYLGRPANPPIALSLESAWEVLCDPERLREEIEKVPPVERRLLEVHRGRGR